MILRVTHMRLRAFERPDEYTVALGLKTKNYGYRGEKSHCFEIVGLEDEKIIFVDHYDDKQYEVSLGHPTFITFHEKNPNIDPSYRCYLRFILSLRK